MAFCVYHLSSYLIDYKYLSKLNERYRTFADYKPSANA